MWFLFSSSCFLDFLKSSCFVCCWQVNHREMQKSRGNAQCILITKYSSLSSMEKWKEVDIDGDEFKHVLVYYSVFHVWFICCWGEGETKKRLIFGTTAVRWRDEIRESYGLKGTCQGHLVHPADQPESHLIRLLKAMHRTLFIIFKDEDSLDFCFSNSLAWR